MNSYSSVKSFIVVATKCDLRDDDDVNDDLISYEQGRRFAEAIGAAKYLECSAKTTVSLTKR